MTSQYLRSTFSSLREYLTPVTHKSTFAETGEITPEEFVQAGDYLVYKFPTWQWSPAPESKRRDFLPIDKQFLVTRHVPSYVRASDYETLDNNYEEFDRFLKSDDDLDDEGWTSTHTCKIKKGGAELEEEEKSVKEFPIEEPEDINDIDDLIDENAEDVEFTDNKKNDIDDNIIRNVSNDNSSNENNNTVSTKRSYDLYITYSTSYRVPKMYVVGFDSNGSPLTPEQMFEDIASDYRHKTVTIEKAPFLNNTTSVSIHPCKHSTVMKVLMKRALISANQRINESQKNKKLIKNVSKLGLADSNAHETEDDWEDIKPNSDNENDTDNENENEQHGIRVDQYLIVFLKFMSSVTPGIEHDYTMEAL